ncbi:hypothetical protein HALDL1_10965 [Halobacterium sp. DL1]|jgi:hypothetical protein|nr:hypothetical protein HALDL1_10965 [Halobacterium sp. DL1]
MNGTFERDTVAQVASTLGVSESGLASAAASVQAAVDDYPGTTVDGLVYEWRQAFREDPLVERTGARWVLRVPERVWEDLCNRAGVRDDLRLALATLHGTESAEKDDEADDDVDRVTLVLGRA